MLLDELKEYASLHQAAQARTSQEWIELMAQSADGPVVIDGIPIPGAPPKDAQAIFHGNGGREAVMSAMPLYRYAIDVCRKHGMEPINTLLDFGCGWGRFMRLFFREVAEGGLFGVDPWNKALQMARTHFPHAAMLQTTFYPPLPFRDDFFDVAFASSVFSHLPEHLALSWILEINRVLRPGGLLIATTHPASLLGVITSMQRGETPINNVWHSILCQALTDPASAEARHAAGEYLFLNTGGGKDISAVTYGDAFVPQAYIRSIWGQFMEVVEFIDDMSRIPQATFVLRKKA